MRLIVNTCKGEYASNEIDASEGDIAIITSMMEGTVSIYDAKSVGGTDCATPAKMRVFKLGVNRKANKLGCTVSLKHIKATKNEQDIFGHKALFDANFESTLAATGMRVIYGGLQ
jgi:hypothetical protein